MMEDITLEEVAQKFKLSVRATNVCGRQGLKTLKAILNYFDQNLTFLNIRHCGEKTEKELIALCVMEKNIRAAVITSTPQQNQTLLRLSTFDPFQRSTLNQHLQYLISKLSVRCYNSLKEISESYNNREIIEKIFIPEFNFIGIRNVGTRSVEELQEFKSQISIFIDFLHGLGKDQLNKEYSKLIIKRSFPSVSDEIYAKVELAFDDHSNIKVFQLISILTRNCIFSKKELKCFDALYSATIHDRTSNTTISKEAGITRERLRQIKNALSENIENHLLFISNIPLETIVCYNITRANYLNIIDNQFVEKVNTTENVNYNKTFISTVFEILFKASHKILGAREVIYGERKTARKKEYKNCYLINLLLFDCFRFEDFVQDIFTKKTEKRNESFSLHFTGYLYEFIKEEGNVYFDEIKAICEKILLEEFDLLVNSEGYLDFEINSKISYRDSIVRLFETAKEMMTIKQLTELFKYRYQALDISESIVRSILQRDKKMFIYFGRSSTYGLRKWESEFDNIKGGTIREIVREYLSHHDAPKHISEIYSHVSQYRKTYARSILDNLKADESGTFIFYPSCFVGVSGISYDKRKLSFKKMTGTVFTLKVLAQYHNWDYEKFLKLYARNYGYAKEQIDYVLKKKISDGTLTISKNNKLIVNVQNQ